jgi:predicted GNAT family acetyltransferase
MDVRHHENPREFMALARPFYATDTLRHTVALTVMTRYLEVDRTPVPQMATMHDNGNLVGVALRTPPWPVIASGLPTDPALLDVFVSRWLEWDPELSGVSGPRENAEAVGAAWVRQTGGTLREAMASRLYQLGELIPPAVTGVARQATEDDFELLINWHIDFEIEAIGHQRNADELPAAIRRMFEVGYSMLIWEDGGEPVSSAFASAPIGGMSRVGPVYTPPEHRGRGYGSAVTAAVSQRAQAAGARDVILFTDLTNPISNSIYQKIGYRPVYDSTELEFSQLPSRS